MAISNSDGDTSTRAPSSVPVSPDLTEPLTGGAIAAGAAALLAACGPSATGTLGDGGVPGTDGGPPIPLPPPTEISAARFLAHASLVSTSADIERVLSLGYVGWLDEQRSTEPLALTRSQWLQQNGYFDWLETLEDGSVTENEDRRGNSKSTTFWGAERAIWRSILTGPDVLRQRVTLALCEIFVVSINGLSTIKWRGPVIATYVDLLERHAFGNFLPMLKDITLSAAMGNFLSMNGSQKADATGRVPDENYAREVMQLFSIGLHELNNDGTLRLDSSGGTINTYSQNDVSSLAKVFTGWYSDPPNAQEPDSCIESLLPMTDAPKSTNDGTLGSANHSRDAKAFLGGTIPAGLDPEADLDAALNIIFNHPNVGPFIGRQLIQRLVTSNPRPTYVSRVADAFNNNGQGVRGDMWAVIRAILLDPDARLDPNPDEATWRTSGKVREPMLNFAQIARTFGVGSKAVSTRENYVGNDQLEHPSLAWSVGDLTEDFGQSPLRAPSVFNFFRPGYTAPNTELAEQDMQAPEFQMLSEPIVASYVNYMQEFISASLPSAKHNDIALDFAPWRALAVPESIPDLVDEMNVLLAAGQLSASTMNEIVEAASAGDFTGYSDDDELRDNRVIAIVFLIVISPEYLIIK